MLAKWFIEGIDAPDLPPTNIRSVLIDLTRSPQGEKKEQALSTHSSETFHVCKEITNGLWTVQQHWNRMVHVSSKNGMS
jgi:hypothetical protein